MVELNLLPDVKREFLKAQRSRNTVTSVAILVILASLGLVVLMALFVFGAQKAQIFFYNQSIEDRSKQLQSVNEIDKYVTLQNQLTHLQALHDQKNVYSRFMDFFQILNPNSPNQVALSGVEIDNEESTIQLTGNTASFESFNVFKDTLINATVTYKADADSEPISEPLFSDLQIESAALGEFGNEQRVSFSVTLTYNQSAFLASSTSVSLKVPNKETTGSALSAPSPVFGGGQ